LTIYYALTYRYLFFAHKFRQFPVLVKGRRCDKKPADKVLAWPARIKKLRRQQNQAWARSAAAAAFFIVLF
jgi:hypothetical protein